MSAISVTELRETYEEAYGEAGIYMLLGAMFYNLSDHVVYRLHNAGRESIELKEKTINETLTKGNN